jgi:GntR family transcriptional regulator, transcriptional repressor for pyruvate dehydrogenase complex
MSNQPEFQAVARSTIYVQVAEQIRVAILDGSLASGARLPPERELARQFGVSRATVREALRHLQAQGLLAPQGRTSPMQTAGPDAAVARFREALTHVVRLREVSLPDLIELRLALETAALVRAAADPVERHLEQARDALAVMSKPDVSWLEFAPADVDFHAALVAASGNQALVLVMQAVKDGIELHLNQTMRQRSFKKLREGIVKEHAALLRTVERGDAERAASLLRHHVTEFYGS